MNTLRKLSPEDSARIGCQWLYDLDLCGKPATVCQTVHWDTGNTKGVSFFYYCDEHTPKESK